MQLPLFIFEFISWIYTAGTKEFLKAWGNAEWFLYRFFSIPLLMRTLFEPFHRMSESYGEGIDLERWFSALILNTVMRGVGFVARIFLLLIALGSAIVVGVAGFVALLLFWGAPFVVPLGIIAAGMLLISA